MVAILSRPQYVNEAVTFIIFPYQVIFYIYIIPIKKQLNFTNKPSDMNFLTINLF